MDLKRASSSSKPTEIFSKTNSFKKQDLLPIPRGKKDSDDGLTTKYDYSKVNTKRDDKKLDELTAKYDYSRVAQKRPTMLEKQYNFANSNLLKKETDRKSVADTKRDDKKLPTVMRRISMKPGGTDMVTERPLILGKNNNGNTANENTAANKANAVEPEIPKEIAAPESQIKRNANRRGSMAVNPVKRDTISVTNNVNKSIVSKPDSKSEIKKEPVKEINPNPPVKTDCNPILLLIIINHL